MLVNTRRTSAVNAQEHLQGLSRSCEAPVRPGGLLCEKLPSFFLLILITRGSTVIFTFKERNLFTQRRKVKSNRLKTKHLCWWFPPLTSLNFCSIEKLRTSYDSYHGDSELQQNHAATPREHHQTKGLTNRTMGSESWYISYPSSLRNNNTKWPSYRYFGEREPHRLIFRIFLWNETLSLHI